LQVLLLPGGFWPAGLRGLRALRRLLPRGYRHHRGDAGRGKGGKGNHTMTMRKIGTQLL
jgi:hypothetical protein